ncbi:MAG: metallophosphoesterase family protein [Gemmataceae bacterium]
MYTRIAVLGGIYSNYLALRTALADARGRGAEAIFCLGDLGAFGPHPDRVFPLLRDHGVQCIQGNYDNSIGNDLPDCQCGYTDPRDNHFARLSYAYTFEHTAPANRAWLREQPAQLRFQLGNYRALCCHGSPRRPNEFLWESTTSSAFLDSLFDAHEADVILATHTGIKWRRSLAAISTGKQGPLLVAERHFVNVGVLGRPENDGRTNVWYALLTARPHVEVEFVPVTYDHVRLAAEMRAEGLPPEFIETIETGWWTSCLEVLPGKERRRGRY